MMITPQILSIPPYLSTPWKEISFLYAVPDKRSEKFKLVVILLNQLRVVVPHLDRPTIETIFEAHTRFSLLALEQLQNNVSLSPPALGGGLELLNFAMQHNPAQASAPNLPREMLEKIASIAKAAGMEDLSHFPKAEPHCNCPFCQISRVIHVEKSDDGEEVPDEELKFRTWDIKQSAEKLYLVTNPLDENEHYSVYLGAPLGCTCGLKNCEHIQAVLNS